MTIHWCGTGLSAIPGLRRLIEAGHKVTVWNRTVEKAQDRGRRPDRRHPRPSTSTRWARCWQKGDVIVSMLPGDWHVPLAELAISKQANFVSSSYIAPEMRALDDKAREAGVALVNEVGLDPGIDHLMAHALVDDYRASGLRSMPQNHLSFISYCGGIPKNPNPFRYKFSWSPLGVLKALRSPSKSIRDYAPLDVARPLGRNQQLYRARCRRRKAFEVYPNRDSIPFMDQYHFEDHWPVKEFVRGTLRLNGWADAWSDVFTEIETLSGARR